ncbi:MAG: hypothetical protein ACTSPB_01240 [Candidatus Thorarchaeota archaeon]
MSKPTQKELIKFRTDEKIRLEKERHRLSMLEMQTEHKQYIEEQQIEIENSIISFNKELERLKHELELVEKQMELTNAQTELAIQSQQAYEAMKDANINPQPFDEERFVEIFLKKMMELDELKKKNKHIGG